MDNCFQAVSGKAVMLDHVNSDDISLQDIAHSLARICRYNGHLRKDIWHYSVAQHSILVAELVKPENKIYGFVHDFKEYAVGDRITPNKKAIIDRTIYDADLAHSQGVDYVDGFIQLEDEFEMAIFKHFKIKPPTKEQIDDVKRADLIALLTEKRDLMEKSTFTWAVEKLGYKADSDIIKPQDAKTAYSKFIKYASQLGLI